MYEYFLMLKNFVNGNDAYDSIMDLTIDIAKSGGYHREICRLKNGSYKEKTVYCTEFDSVLVALWILHYKSLFTRKLSKTDILDDNCVDVINKTFLSVMRYIDIDKIKSDRSVDSYVSCALCSRIVDIIRKNSSKLYTGPYEKGKKYSFIQKDAILNQAVSIEYLKEMSPVDFVCDDFSNDLGIRVDIKRKLEDNVFGDKVYNFLIESSKRTNFKNIDKKLGMRQEDCTEENKHDIINAINTIKRTLYDYGYGKSRFRCISPSSVTYSFEVQ